MRKSLAILALALALASAGCSSGDKAAEKPVAGGTAASPSPVQAAPVPAFDPAAPSGGDAQPASLGEAFDRSKRIEAALEKSGLAPQGSETLPMRLGNRDECAPTERRRYNLRGDEVYVIVGTYPDAAAAEACIASYQQFLGGLWDQYKGDFFARGRFVLELNPKMTSTYKQKAIDAVAGAL